MAADAAERLESQGLRLRRGGPAFGAHDVLTAVRDADRRLRGFSLVVRDISERVRLEEDLRKRAEDVAAAVSFLCSPDAAMSRAGWMRRSIRPETG